MTKEEITQELQKRPDIMNLLQLIDSFPEEQKEKAIRTAVEFLKETKNAPAARQR